MQSFKICVQKTSAEQWTWRSNICIFKRYIHICTSMGSLRKRTEEIDNTSCLMMGKYEGLGDRQAYFLLYILLYYLDFKQVQVFLFQKKAKQNKIKIYLKHKLSFSNNYGILSPELLFYKYKCAKQFTYFSFNPCNNPMIQVLLSYLFYIERNCSIDRLS